MATQRTAWTPIAATGEVIDQADMRSIPGGLIGIISLASDVTGITSDQTPITGWTGSVALVSGRRYQIDLMAHVVATSLGGSCSVDTYVDGSQVQLGRVDFSAANRAKTVMTRCIVDGAGSSATIAAYFDVLTAGTYTVYSNATTHPSTIYVSDVGPSTGYS